jgi:carboxymethylenebutenolidase
MTDLARYILEEWAEEYQQGGVTRREFLRRITVFSGGAAAGLAVLRSLGVAASAEEIADAAAAGAPLRAQASGVTVRPDDPDIAVQPVSIPLDTLPVLGYLARPTNKADAQGILVVHENRGLLEHHKDVARRLAKAGYVALAVDLASPGGGTDKFTDPAAVTALLGQTPPDQLLAMLDAGVRHLRGLSGVMPGRLGTVGFCFGGGLVWRLITRNADLRAAVPFYGPTPPLEDVPKIRAAVLGIYGALDQRIDAGMPALRDALQKAGVVHEFVVYAGANHAFFNDTGANYKDDAAKDAWVRTLGWFAKWLPA